MTSNVVLPDNISLEPTPVVLRGLGKTYLASEFERRVTVLDQLAADHGVVVQFSSGYRDQEKQDALRHDPSAITPASKSLHSAGLAVDIHWNNLTVTERSIVLDAARQAGVSWGGAFRSPDPVHFYFDPGVDRQWLINTFAAKLERLLEAT